jgi:rhodanese-related sulfurtransferase
VSRPPFIHLLFALLGIVVLAAAGWGIFHVRQPSSMQAMKEEVRRKFPGVPQLSTKELAEWLVDSKRSPPLLLDVRTEAEFGVSHLKGAQRVSTDDVAALEIPKDRPVVVYCSVGYRSSSFAAQLQQRDKNAKVYNLEGSMFQWANEHRPIYKGETEAHEVHPYNEKWGQLLESGLRAKVPAVN